MADANNENDTATERNALILKLTNHLVVALAVGCTACAIFYAALYLSNSTNVPAALFVMMLGILGGFISVQRRLKDFDTSELKLLAGSRAYVFLAPFASGILAVILYCIFIGGLLKGPLFPDFREGPEFHAVSTSKEDPPYKEGPKGKTGLWTLFYCEGKTYADYGKLAVWSFLAGYSEMLVTNVLGKIGTSVSKKEERPDGE